MKSTTHINIIFILTCCYSMLMCVGNTISSPYLLADNPTPIRFKEFVIGNNNGMSRSKYNTNYDVRIEHDFTNSKIQLDIREVSIKQIESKVGVNNDVNIITDITKPVMSHDQLVKELLKFFQN